MTYAPESIEEAQVYLQGVTGLPWPSLGIVADGYGDSYHRGKDRLGARPRYGYYSVEESQRDENGLTNGSSALDIGKFSVTRQSRRLTLFGFNRWLVGECERGAPDTKDIREVIYTLDGKTVKRWDRLKKRSSGDDSHLTHTHISWFRDAENRDKLSLFKRYFEGDDDMPTVKEVWDTDGMIPAPAGSPNKATNPTWKPNSAVGRILDNVYDLPEQLSAAKLRDEAILAAVKGLDTKAVLARINEVAKEEAARDAAIRGLLEQHADGSLDAAEVVRQMGELLSGAQS